MYCVYVLYSSKHNRIYIGETANLIERFKSHNQLGKKGYTIRYRPWVVAYVEFFETRSEAIKREKSLKQGQGRMWIRENILPKYS
jgi:putative endonuclease